MTVVRDETPMMSRVTGDTVSQSGQVNSSLPAQASFASGLKAMAEESSSPRTRRALLSLVQKLDSGESVVEAVEALGPSLPTTMRLLVTRSNALSRLEKAIPRLVEHFRFQQELVRGVWLPLLTPFCTFVASLAVVMVVLVALAPTLHSVQMDFGAPDKRWGTWILFGVCRIAAEHPLTICISAVAATAAMAGVMWGCGRRCLASRWLCFAPYLSGLSREAGLAEFFDLLAIFIDAEWDLSMSVRTAGEAVSHSHLRGQSRRMAKELEQGISPEMAVLSAGLPWAMGSLMRGSPPPIPLAESIHGLGRLYGMRAQERAHRVAGLTWWAPFVVLFGGVLFVFGLISHLFWHTTLHSTLG